jgi:hypothetical protein
VRRRIMACCCYVAARGHAVAARCLSGVCAGPHTCDYLLTTCRLLVHHISGGRGVTVLRGV